MNLCKVFKKSKEQAHRVFTQKQNKTFLRKFSKTPFNERVIFVPHCMRKTSLCKAKEQDSYYICANCGQCKIGEINKLAKQFGYKALYILKGGRAITKIIESDKPKAVLGVACFYEGDLAFKLLKDYDLAVQFVNLTRDGCADTDADLSAVSDILKMEEEK
ncbi:MAG: DUF116 domain-containing protein [Endomicrobium sp.]|jgi:hypothetical protein|nr:DUF116 domain-containing protein [Endomicrobium sp.]